MFDLLDWESSWWQLFFVMKGSGELTDMLHKLRVLADKSQSTDGVKKAQNNTYLQGRKKVLSNINLI